MPYQYAACCLLYIYVLFRHVLRVSSTGSYRSAHTLEYCAWWWGGVLMRLSRDDAVRGTIVVHVGSRGATVWSKVLAAKERGCGEPSGGVVARAHAALL